MCLGEEMRSLLQISEDYVLVEGDVMLFFKIALRVWNELEMVNSLERQNVGSK